MYDFVPLIGMAGNKQDHLEFLKNKLEMGRNLEESLWQQKQNLEKKEVLQSSHKVAIHQMRFHLLIIVLAIIGLWNR